MSVAARPLISRLRPRLFALVWLLALAIVGKSVFASACLADGLIAPAESGVASVQVSPDAAAHEDDAAACWHSGAGGCHCSCVHASAVPLVAAAWTGAPLGKTLLPAPADSSRQRLILPSLRPPIS
jgi:hypothetical protein